MHTHVFEQACLLQLHTACWQGSKMLDPAVIEQIGDSDWLKGRKYLVKPEALQPVRAVISRARKFIAKSALPFPIDGLNLVPKAQIETIELGIKQHENLYWGEVNDFLGRYAVARLEARDKLRDLFSEADYPQNIHLKFNFAWQYLAIDVPGKATILTPEMYQREVEKFHTMMQETEQLALTALRTEFAGLVDHMLERLTANDDGTTRVFRDTLVTNMKDFFGSYDARNLFGDDRLTGIVSHAREILSGVNPQTLRDNDAFKSHIQNQMERIKAAVDQAVQDLPRRKIRLEQAA